MVLFLAHCLRGQSSALVPGALEQPAAGGIQLLTWKVMPNADPPFVHFGVVLRLVKIDPVVYVGCMFNRVCPFERVSVQMLAPSSTVLGIFPILSRNPSF